MTQKHMKKNMKWPNYRPNSTFTFLKFKEQKSNTYQSTYNYILTHIIIFNKKLELFHKSKHMKMT